ncbi:uncharacterized protein DUF1566 [Desulfobotulus alkaliphilus]|uniref:Uncharacterized protein DUF1566 n=1 Tax=Desulfobotulus alkaliphilus TaxID=622671 RepID=A0A562R686_9BACT|nr:DUF1566 domain-containing protein [Desulfobotulus alkaliphilus]TWI63940.1 uncharacterized protein DUF1566 [Desulfobotulus alkaliphilus]
MKEKIFQRQMLPQKNLVLVLGMVIFFCVAGTVQAAQQPQPPPRFQEVEGSGGSIVRDNNTGLEWQRCPHGQSWTGASCSGTTWTGNWQDATRVTASAGFRLPTIDEMRTLAPYDQGVFPGSGWFWSSSPVGKYDARVLSFDSGRSDILGKLGNYRARLVRGG